MKIVRYADDFVILARKLKEEFVRRIEGGLEGRFGLVVNRDKTKVLNLRSSEEGISFLGYEFRYRQNRYGKGKYLHWCPSMKSVTKVCAKIHEATLSRMKPVSNEDLVKRLNPIIRGWGNYFHCGYTHAANQRVNWYAKERMYIRSRRRSQWGYRLKYAETFYGELTAMGIYRLREEAFAQLPPPLREAYTPFQVMEMSIREIAVCTGTSEANVKVRIFRAKEKLRPLLADLLL